jgi:oligoribonuclease (3'-5' exoribonuclease)
VSAKAREDVLVFFGLFLVDRVTLQPRGSDPKFSQVVRPAWEDSKTVDAEFLRYRADPVVREMHDLNGLWADLKLKGISLEFALADAVTWLLNQLKVKAEEPWQPVMVAGNGLDRFDRPFLKATALGRQLDSMFHYRSLDISAVRQGLKVAGLDLPELGRPITHRALDDCISECDEWSLLVQFLRPLAKEGA